MEGRDNLQEILSGYDSIIIPGGFGDRGGGRENSDHKTLQKTKYQSWAFAMVCN